MLKNDSYIFEANLMVIEAYLKKNDIMKSIIKVFYIPYIQLVNYPYKTFKSIHN